MNLPTPPPAYWDHVPWWAFIFLLGVVAVLASPVTLQVLRGRGTALLTREQAFAVAQDRLVALKDADRAEVARQRDEAWAALDRERASGLRWFAVARGWEELAHRMRHTANGHLTTANLRLQAAGQQLVATELPPLPELEAVEQAGDSVRNK